LNDIETALGNRKVISQRTVITSADVFDEIKRSGGVKSTPANVAAEPVG